MIGVYTKNIGGVCFGVACPEQSVFNTAFPKSQQEALKKLPSGIALNVPFQVFTEPSVFADNVLASIKNVYNGNDVSKSLSLVASHLSVYAQRILEAGFYETRAIDVKEVPSIRVNCTITNIVEETAYNITLHAKSSFSNGTQLFTVDLPLI